jgi:hypothetical protein
MGHTTLGQLNATNMCVLKHVNANAGEHCLRDNLIDRAIRLMNTMFIKVLFMFSTR